MIPVKHTLNCYKGQTFSQGIYFKSQTTGDPIPLDGITAKAQIRPTENSTCLIAEFTATVFPEDGKVSLELDAEDTANLTPGVNLWDLKLTDEAGNVAYYICGKFIVEGRITE